VIYGYVLVSFLKTACSGFYKDNAGIEFNRYRDNMSDFRKKIERRPRRLPAESSFFFIGTCSQKQLVL